MMLIDRRLNFVDVEIGVFSAFAPLNHERGADKFQALRMSFEIRFNGTE